MTSEGTTIEGEGKRTRAAALPPSERRAEIIAATLPLVREHGANVTTRQIAEAAGIASPIDIVAGNVSDIVDTIG